GTAPTARSTRPLHDALPISSHRLALFIAEAGQHVLRRPVRAPIAEGHEDDLVAGRRVAVPRAVLADDRPVAPLRQQVARIEGQADRKSTRLNSSHVKISYAV